MDEIEKIEYYTKIIDELSSKNFESEELFWAYIERGMSFFENIEYDRAILDFENAISIMPDEGVPYYNLGIIYKRKKDFDRAFYYFERAIDLKFGNNAVYYELGLLYLEKEDYEKAVENFGKAISSGRRTADVFYYRAISFMKLLKYDEAIRDLDIASKIKPSNSDYYIMLANIYTITHNYEKAIDALSMAIKIKPDISIYRFDRSILFATLGSIIKLSKKRSVDSIIFKKWFNIIERLQKDDENFYYKLAEKDINYAMELEQIFYGLKKINPSYYLTRGAIYRWWGKEAEAFVNFILARNNLVYIKPKGNSDNRLLENYHAISALTYLYLQQWDDAKKHLDSMLNNDIISRKLDILYSCYWWASKRDFDRAYFWFNRAVKNGFDIYDIMDDIFEGYFLSDFIDKLEAKGMI
ncbi:MAG: tetratricopeptide repeat protein [Elusimicrobiota bacterium]